MSTAKWAKPEHIKKIMRAAKNGRVRFAFTTGKHGDLLMMDDALEPKALLTKAKSESGNTKGCAGEAWIEGPNLVLQTGDAIPGLRKKFSLLAEESGFKVKKCKVLNAAGQEVGEGGGAGEETAPEPSSSPAPESEWSAPSAPGEVNLGVAGMTLAQSVALAGETAPGGDVYKELRDHYTGMFSGMLVNRTLPELVADARSRFPDVPAGPELVKLLQTLQRKAKGGSVSPGALLTGSLDGVEEYLKATYLANLPSGVDIKLENGLVRLTKKGAAVNVTTDSGDVAGQVGPAGAAFSFKNKSANIEIENSSLKKFDPKLRAKLERLEGETQTVLDLQADLEKLRLKVEDERKAGKSVVELEVDLRKREADLKLKTDALQGELEAHIKATAEGLVASIQFLREESKDKQAGAELKVETEAMVARFKAWKQSPEAKTGLEILASAKQLAVKLEHEAAKSGVVVTAEFKAAVKEIEAALAIVADKGDKKLAAKLKKQTDAILVSLETVVKTKDLQLAAKLESDLKSVRGELEATFKRGDLGVTLGVKGDSGKGEIGGTAKVDLALLKGISILGGQDGKLQFAADVSNKGYSVGIVFSIGSPPDPKELSKALDQAEKGIQDLYARAADPKVRSLDDLDAAAKEISGALKPFADSASRLKQLDRQKFSLDFSLSLTGGWPVGGRVSPPTPMFGLAIRF
jgi:hypothetical protein